MQIIRTASVITADRHEVQNAALWDDSSGSDYFFEPDAAQISGTGSAEDLSDVGWTIDGFTYVSGVGGDFLSKADRGVPSHYLIDAPNDLLQSPDLFGNFDHGHQAGHHLGDIEPTTLTFEWEAAWSTASNNETASAMGIAQAAGAINVAAEQLAAIFSDGSNFGLRSSGDSDVGAVVDNDWHTWKIVFSQGITDAIEWFIDGVSQGTIDLLEDVMPFAWGAGILVSTGANNILMGDCRAYYR